MLCTARRAFEQFPRTREAPLLTSTRLATVLTLLGAAASPDGPVGSPDARGGDPVATPDPAAPFDATLDTPADRDASTPPDVGTPADTGPLDAANMYAPETGPG